MRIYGLKNCDSCRKAVKALPEAELVDVRADGLPNEVLDAALAQFQGALVNTRSATWRGLEEADRALPARDLILAHPAVMKRPLIAAGDALFLGWSPQTHADIKAQG
ncbi:putative reductase [Sulfitobacter sp. THAF37]|uniref:arsenate reductase family protein n=1 Tax=Sulfitobacter sp. THAF37 TaxID=2587855 RepID=UPI001268DCA6|nr:ArsC/Spx/MgsR family protein [Sulfitobacter sp. THAF37]QFT57202.1 putative reductase [Sulfitobacter sp. THAF37]